MQARCAQAVREAAKAMGRKQPSDADLNAIEERLTETVRQLARTDPKWKGYSKEARARLAAGHAGDDIRADAARKAVNAREQLVAQADLQAIEARMAELRPSAPRPEPVTGKLSVAREEASAAAARQEFYRAADASRQAGSITHGLVGEVLVDVPIMAGRLVKKALSGGAVKEKAAARDYAALKMRAAELRVQLAKLQADPEHRLAIPTEPRVQRFHEAAGEQGEQRMTLDQVMVTRLASHMPDLEVTIPGREERTTMSNALPTIREELARDMQWADLVRAAAECALGA